MGNGLLGRQWLGNYGQGGEGTQEASSQGEKLAETSSKNKNLKKLKKNKREGTQEASSQGEKLAETSSKNKNLKKLKKNKREGTEEASS